MFGASLLAYEAWDVRMADVWLVLAGLALMGAPLAQSAIDARRRPPPLHRRPWAPPYDQDAET